MPARVVSCNLSAGREVIWAGTRIVTGIFKEPALDGIDVGARGVAGDLQADPSVHGGPAKAVYVYTAEAYEYWRGILQRDDLGWGAFGENLTSMGLHEGAVHVGDCYCIGPAVLRVTAPRLPCFKLNIRFGRRDMVRKFLLSGFPGFYAAVLEPGRIRPGDAMERICEAGGNATVTGEFEWRAGRLPANRHRRTA